jgi:hypothetical protein
MKSALTQNAVSKMFFYTRKIELVGWIFFYAPPPLLFQTYFEEDGHIAIIDMLVSRPEVCSIPREPFISL